MCDLGTSDWLHVREARGSHMPNLLHTKSQASRESESPPLSEVPLPRYAPLFKIFSFAPQKFAPNLPAKPTTATSLHLRTSPLSLPLHPLSFSLSLSLSLSLNPVPWDPDVCGTMVVALGPGRFYGSSLPRPRFYGDSKLNGGDRVDPPASVTEPLLMWAREAHWSMGGLSFQRHRLQGRIEGSIRRLRAHLEKEEKKKKAESSILTPPSRHPLKPDETEEEEETEEGGEEEETEEEVVSVVSNKRKRVGKMAEEKVVPVVSNKRKRVRKLGEEFDRVAAKEGIATRTRSRRSAADDLENDAEMEAAAAAAVPVRRTSPRKKNSKDAA